MMVRESARIEDWEGLPFWYLVTVMHNFSTPSSPLLPALSEATSLTRY